MFFTEQTFLIIQLKINEYIKKENAMKHCLKTHHDPFKEDMEKEGVISCVDDIEPQKIEKLINLIKLPFHKLKLKKNENIFFDGKNELSIYYIKSGYSSLEYSRSNGQHHIIQFNCPGEIIGVDGWSHGLHYLNANALSEMELWCLKIKDTQQAMEFNQEFYKTIHNALIKFYLSNQDHIFSLGIHSAQQKLAFFLLNFYTKTSSIDNISLPMNRIDLTNHLGMTSETLSRSFSDLENRGLIFVKNRKISFLNIKNLQQLIL